MIQLVLSALLVLSMGFGALATAQTELTVIGVSASSHQGQNVPGNTMDGDLETRWSAEGNREWVRYEMDGCPTVSSVDIAWYLGDTRRAFFDIELSDNGDDWRISHRGQSNGQTLELQPVALQDETACFVRIVGFGNSRNRFNSITEVVIRGEPDVSIDPPVDPIPPPGEVEGVRASTFQPPNAPENTLDGDLETRWSAQGVGEWIEYDFGEDGKTFNQVMIAWFRGDRRSAAFRIEVSDDADSWTLIYSGYSSGTTLELQAYGFAPVTSRYVRIVGLGNSQNNWNSLTEVAFGLLN